jgi:enterochelin esterase-like enzyme
VPPFIVVMPGGGSTWWVDGVAVQAQRALVHDLLPHIDGTLRTLPTRQGRMIAGLSAGGYGALLAALQHAERFAAAGVFSPAAYVPEPPADSAARQATAFAVQGRFDPATWQRLNYPAAWAAYAAGPHTVPTFLHSGDHDHLGIAQQAALLFQRFFGHQPQQVELRIVDGGHDWAVWRRGLAEALPYLTRFVAIDAAAPAATPASPSQASCAG